MKKVIALIGVLLGAVSFSAAQSTAPVYASNFAQWALAGQQALVAGTNNQVPFGPCVAYASGYQFNVLTNAVPVIIADNTPSLSETATPSNVAVVGTSCTATITTVNTHGTNYRLISGTQGLQEAINATNKTSQVNTINLDQQFYNLGGGPATLNTVTGGANFTIKDITNAVDPIWRWSGSHFISGATVFSSPQSAVPAIAAGPAAGTSPTIAANAASNGYVMTIALTEGTSPTTGTLFTLTYTPVWAGTGANCVIKSIGINSGPVVTAVQTSTTVETFTVAVAPTASTPYVYTVQCE